MLEFEWDDTKAAINAEKHGIQFTEAALVVRDSMVVMRDATKPEHGEERFIAIGAVDRGILAVIYTDRSGKRWIIAARNARRHERRDYDQRKTASGWDVGSGAS